MGHFIRYFLHLNVLFIAKLRQVVLQIQGIFGFAHRTPFGLLYTSIHQGHAFDLHALFTLKTSALHVWGDSRASHDNS